MKIVAILALGLFAGALSAPALPVKRRSADTLSDSEASQMLIDLQEADTNNAQVGDDGISSVFDEENFDVVQVVAKETNSEEVLTKTVQIADAEVNANDDSFSAFMDDSLNNGNNEVEEFLASNGLAALNGDGVPVLNKLESELTEEELEKLANGELVLGGQQGEEDMAMQIALYGEANAHSMRRRSTDESHDYDSESDMYDLENDGISTVFDEQNFAVGKMAVAEMDHNEEVSVFTSDRQSDANGNAEDSFVDFMSDNVNNGNDEFAELEQKGVDIVDGDSAMPGSELTHEELSQLVNTELADANKLVNGHSEETETAEETVQDGTKEALQSHADANSAQDTKDEDSDVSYLDELQAAASNDDSNKEEAAKESSENEAAVSQRHAVNNHEELQQLREESERSVGEDEDAAMAHHEKDRDQAVAEGEADEAADHDRMMDSKLDSLMELQELSRKQNM